MNPYIILTDVTCDLSPEIREYFEGKDWYSGQYSDVTLSALETANVNFIAQYEKDHFGGSYY